MEQMSSKTNAITVSYLVSSYNHEAYIIQCLESIKADLHEPSEIIIVDDGSTDNSENLIREWISKNNINVVFVTRANLGIAATLNELFKLAQGQYYRTVSSDDTIKPNSTLRLINELNKNEKALVAFGDVETIDENGSLISKSHMISLNNGKSLYQKDLKQAIISKWSVCGPCWLLKKDFYKTIGLFDESLIIEDWNMYLRLVSRDAVIFTDTIVASYRIHGANTSRTKNTKRRVANLKSQMLAGEKNLNNFIGTYRLLLLAELFLIRAKIQFLSKKYLLTSLSILAFLGLKICSILGIYFKRMNQ